MLRLELTFPKQKICGCIFCIVLLQYAEHVGHILFAVVPAYGNVQKMMVHLLLMISIVIS